MSLSLRAVKDLTDDVFQLVPQVVNVSLQPPRLWQDLALLLE